MSDRASINRRLLGSIIVKPLTILLAYILVAAFSVSISTVAIASPSAAQDSEKDLQGALRELASPQQQVRVGALAKLQQVCRKDPKAVTYVISALHDKDYVVREVAARTLGKIGPIQPEIVPALVDQLQDDNSWDAADEALRRIGADIASPEIARRLSDPGFRMRERLFFMLGVKKNLSKDAVPNLLRAMEVPGIHDKGRIALLISEADPTAVEAVPLMIEAMTGPDYRLIAQALSRMNSPEAQKISKRAAWILRIEHLLKALPWWLLFGFCIGFFIKLFLRQVVPVKFVLAPILSWCVIWFVFVLWISMYSEIDPFSGETSVLIYAQSGLIYGTAFLWPMIACGTFLTWAILGLAPLARRSTNISAAGVALGMVSSILFFASVWFSFRWLTTPIGNFP